MAVPVIPTIYGVIVFVLLFGLLFQKEIMRALGQAGTRGWKVATNSTIGLLLVLYAFILLTRFLNLL